MSEKELKFKLKEYPNVRHNMMKHKIISERFLEKATEEQLQFCESYFNEDIEILFNESSAGCGKTFCSVVCAYADYLNTGRHLYFIISPVAEDLGSRPGNQTEKEMAYFMGLHDALAELDMYPEQVVFELANLDDNPNKESLSDCWVHQVSHLFLRGGNLRDSVIVNESQNFTRGELKKVLTRLHTVGNKCVVEGNFKQVDLRNAAKSGFEDYMNYFKQYDAASFHSFSVNFRSKLANFADNFNWK